MVSPGTDRMAPRSAATIPISPASYRDGWRRTAKSVASTTRCSFPPVEYLVDVAVHARNGLAYDYWCDALKVRVTSEVEWPGVWSPPHRWRSTGPEWEESDEIPARDRKQVMIDDVSRDRRRPQLT